MDPTITMADGATATLTSEDELAEAVNGPMIRLWCEMVHDADPRYHDTAFARSRGYRDIVAPPTMLLAWLFQPTWRPDGGTGKVHARDMPDVPGFPNAALIRMTQSYRRLLEVGERPRLQAFATEPSAPIQTRRGAGVIIRHVRRLVDDEGAELVRQDSEILRFDRLDPSPPRPLIEFEASPADPADPAVGARLDPLSLPLDPTRFVIAAAASRDFYAVHHDDDSARATGAEAIFIGTQFVQGLVGRFLTDWSGPDGDIVELDLVPYAHANPGDTMSVHGVISAVEAADGATRVAVNINVGTERRQTHKAAAVIELRRKGDAGGPGSE